jgi:hypothetical protein
MRSMVLLLPKQQMLCLLKEEGFRNDFIRVLMKKQRYLTERILYLTAYELEERFFRYLAERYGQRDEYFLSLSKKEFSSMNVSNMLAFIPEADCIIVLRHGEKVGDILKRETSIDEITALITGMRV